jgi:secreted Zn-dependent insulinase-like peptidase
MNLSNDGEGGFGIQKEKWYGVDYYLSPIPSEHKVTWTTLEKSDVSNLVQLDKLHLPSVNRFIPRDLSLCSDLPEEAKKGPRISKEIDPPNLVAENHLGKYAFDTFTAKT